MSRRIRWAVLAVVALATTAGWTDSRPSALVELPVAVMKLVSPDDYREASALAARGGAALDVALKVVGPFEGSAQQIMQVNDGGEAPSRSRVTVVRDGLLDDSVRGERWLQSPREPDLPTAGVRSPSAGTPTNLAPHAARPRA